MTLSRRSLLLTASAFSTLAAGEAIGARQLTVELRTLEVNRRAVTVGGIRGPAGTSGLTLAPGERFHVTLANKLTERTIVHWHGQTPPAGQDGVEDTGEPPIPTGASRVYDFAARPGTHWMHSHIGFQEQQLFAAPLIVRSAEEASADIQDVVVFLHDFTFRPPEQVMADLDAGGGMGTGGRGRGGPGMMGGGMMGGGMMGGGMMQSATVDYDAHLANDHTLSDPPVIPVERRGRVRLRLINGSSSSAYWIDLGALNGTVLAADGNPVRPVQGRYFPLATAQRLDILLELSVSAGVFPVLALAEGTRMRTGVILSAPGGAVRRIPTLSQEETPQVDLSLEAKLSAASPLPVHSLASTYRVTLTGGMMGYVWGIDGRTWEGHAPLLVRRGQSCVLEFINDSMMPHPMHLHGHHFQVIALNGQRFQGAVRDTVLVPPMTSVTVAFVADNPGRWLLHCHNLYHMMAGMMTEVVYA